VLVAVAVDLIQDLILLAVMVVVVLVAEQTLLDSLAPLIRVAVVEVLVGGLEILQERAQQEVLV
jgi:hypothetical protein